MSPHLEGRDRLEESLAPLSPGIGAPAFALSQAPRSILRLHSSGGQAVVLVFYPMDWEPVSREQLALCQALIDAFDRLGAHVLGISADHMHSHQAFARDAQLHFPLLADCQPRGRVAKQYGVWREAQNLSARALFVLDRRHVVRFGKAFPDELNPGVEELLTALEVPAAGHDPGNKRTGGR